MPSREQPKRSPSGNERKTVSAAARVEPMLVCPNCGSGLTERKCKLLCPNPICGYYLSCSDFY